MACLEVEGLDSRSGLIVSDFVSGRVSATSGVLDPVRRTGMDFATVSMTRHGHEGKSWWQYVVNVDSEGFHEGRAREKGTTPGGREKHAYFFD